MIVMPMQHYSFRFSVMCKESWHEFWDKFLNAGKDCRIKYAQFLTLKINFVESTNLVVAECHSHMSLSEHYT